MRFGPILPWLGGLIPAVAPGCVLLGATELQEETALIEWNPATRTERFVRAAGFGGGPGVFLVPTPSRPAVASREMDWDRLARLTAPEKYLSTIWVPIPLLDLFVFATMREGGFGCSKSAEESSAPSMGVEEVEIGTAGGSAYRVLRADDAAALAAYLRKHGLDGGATLTEWLKPYTRNGFHLTAFRVIPEKAQGNVELTFRTDRPFYPYREPEEAKRSANLLLYVSAPTGMDVEGLKPTFRAPRPDGTWITRYLDITDRRARTDLWFVPSREEVRPRPVPDEDRRIIVPIGTPVMVLGLAVWRRRRNRSWLRH